MAGKLSSRDKWGGRAYGYKAKKARADIVLMSYSVDENGESQGVVVYGPYTSAVTALNHAIKMVDSEEAEALPDTWEDGRLDDMRSELERARDRKAVEVQCTGRHRYGEWNLEVSRAIKFKGGA